MASLSELSAKHGSDKHLVGYTDFYETFLGPQLWRMYDDLDGNPLKGIRILEIGVGTPEVMQHIPNYHSGASLRMWQEYFLDYADVFGADKEPQSLENCFNLGAAFETYTCDQTKRNELIELAQRVRPLDLVIDDGEHTAKAALSAVSVLFDCVSPGGFYIIEDAVEHEEIWNGLNELGIENFSYTHLSKGGKLFLLSKS